LYSADASFILIFLQLPGLIVINLPTVRSRPGKPGEPDKESFRTRKKQEKNTAPLKQNLLLPLLI